MGYENTAGLGVNNHYGPRDTGGTEGVIKTEGTMNEYAINLDGEGPLGLPFPVGSGVEVIGIDNNKVTGTTTTVTIGGTAVQGATEGSPVSIPSSNSGNVNITGTASAGTLLIKFKRYL